LGRRDQGGKRKTQKLRLPVNTGIRSDTFAEDVTLQDINNFVLTPDGTAICPRPGFEIRRQTIIGLDSDRKKIYFLSDPPDIDGGDLIVIVNNKNGDLRVELTEVVRSAGESDNDLSSYSPSIFTLPLGASAFRKLFVSTPGVYTTGKIIVLRGGDISGYSSCRVATSAGTAPTSWYTAIDEVYTFTPGETNKIISLEILDTSALPSLNTVVVTLSEFSYGSGAGTINPQSFIFTD